MGIEGTAVGSTGVAVGGTDVLAAKTPGLGSDVEATTCVGVAGSSSEEMIPLSQRYVTPISVMAVATNTATPIAIRLHSARASQSLGLVRAPQYAQKPAVSGSMWPHLEHFMVKPC